MWVVASQEVTAVFDAQHNHWIPYDGFRWSRMTENIYFDSCAYLYSKKN